MKKIFTILLAVGTIGVASAQSTAHRSSGPSYDKGYNSGYGTSSLSVREKESQIRKINYEFDRKVTAVKMNRRLRSQEKSRQIWYLNKQRAEEIRLVQIRFEKSNRRMDDRRYDNNRGYRS